MIAVSIIKEREMLNFRIAHHSGDGEDESERKIAIQNKKETYEIFTKSKKMTRHKLKIKLTMRRNWTNY